jgi:AcrR family transcriptional regulator
VTSRVNPEDPGIRTPAAGRGAPGRPRVPREVRERQMIRVASQVFAKAGYDAASMDEIAAGAGISKKMLYGYFGSKEGLFAACAEAAGARLRERVRAAAEHSDLPADRRLWAGLLEVFEFVDRHHEAWQILYPSGHIAPGSVGAGAIRAREAMGKLLAELFARTAREAGMADQGAAQTEAMAHMVTAATIAAASWWSARRDEPKELAALRLMNLVWVGFAELLKGQVWLPDLDSSSETGSSINAPLRPKED